MKELTILWSLFCYYILKMTNFNKSFLITFYEQ